MAEQNPGELPSFMLELALEKKFHLAKEELYPHIRKVVDALIEVKGVAYTTADNHDASREALWVWVLDQVK